MSDLNKKQRNSIDKKLNQLNDLRPIPRSSLNKLREHFKVQMTYNSNAIEGNSLTQNETFLVINEGVTVKGKSLKDHLEATDHYAALDYLYETTNKKKGVVVTEQDVRSLHQLVTNMTEKEWAGQYRTRNVLIAGSEHIPPEAIDVKFQMKELVKWLNTNQESYHIVELAALFHHKLVHIHPFLDGNGRTARLSMNLLLLNAGYPLVVILKNDRRKYYRVLQQADKANYRSLVQFIAQAVERSLDVYLKTLMPSSKNSEKFMLLSELAQKSPYSAKYLNLLVRQGKLEAHKEGRVWLSSVAALNRYLEGRKRKPK